MPGKRVLRELAIQPPATTFRRSPAGDHRGTNEGVRSGPLVGRRTEDLRERLLERRKRRNCVTPEEGLEPRHVDYDLEPRRLVLAFVGNSGPIKGAVSRSIRGSTAL